MNNYMKLEFLNLSENEKFARCAVASFATQLNPTLEEIDDLKAAVSEAVTNAVVHAYQEDVGTIHIFCEITDGSIKVVVKDSGCGIEDIPLARTPLYTGAKNSERSGLGFTVMEAFMDDVSVESEKGVGTTITLTKKIGVVEVKSEQ